MYQEFYNFSAEPFRLSPDHQFSYSHKGYSKARAYMAYAFMRAEGFVMITGQPGTGKTTLIRGLLDELANTSVSVANLVCTQLKADDLLKMVAYDFGIPTTFVEKGELLQHLSQQLKSWHRDGRRALLIVDEAQDLSISAMEELRLLTNIQVDSRPLLQIFLLGQPELRELILSPELEQVHQRIIAASHLQPLEAEETEAYIRHRLETVNWRGDPAISKAVYPLVYKFSEGIPRRINLICSRLLLHCAVEQKRQIRVADLRDVVQELQNENLASGNKFAESDFQVEDFFEEEVPKDTGKDGKDKDKDKDNTNGKDKLAATKKSSARRSQTASVTETDIGNEPQDVQAMQNSSVLAGSRTAEDEISGMETVPQLRVVTGAGQTMQTSEQSTATTPARRLQSVRDRGPHPALTQGASEQPITAGPRYERKASPRRTTKADVEGGRKSGRESAEQKYTNKMTWPIVILVVGTFSVATWAALDFDVTYVVDLMPAFLTNFLNQGLSGFQ